MKLNQLVQMVGVSLLVGTSSFAEQAGSDIECRSDNGETVAMLSSCSPEEVRGYFREANAGVARAQNVVGSFYLHGLHVKQSYEEAFRWFRKAAEQGDIQAQCNLAHCYDYGWGVELSEEKALSWYLKAAKRGNLQS